MKLLEKNILKYFSLKQVAIVLLAVVFSISAGFAAFFSLKKDVTIYVDGVPTIVKTMKSTVKEVLEQNSIEVGQYDYLSQPLDHKLQRINNNELYIKRAFPVIIQADGEEKKVMTYRDRVDLTLKDAGITLEGQDRLEGAALEEMPKENMNLKVVRVAEKEVSEYSGIPFETVKKENNRLDMGKENILVQGQEGKKEKKFKVTLENGVEVARQLITELIVANPIDKVVEFGTVLNHKTARGDVVRYSKVLDMKASGYSLSYEQTGKNPGDYGYGITASGLKAQKGVIGVDPRVIPLGTKLYVEVAGSTPDYGFAVAGDTGSGIKPNYVDLFFEDYNDARNWGLKNVKVYILQD